MNSSNDSPPGPRVTEGIRDDLYKALIDAIPDPVFVVDGNVRVLDCNPAAAEMIGDSMFFPSGLGCDMLRCVNANPQGCGLSAACRGCAIRNSVALALKGERPRRTRYKLERMGEEGPVVSHFLVTAAPLNYQGSHLALLILEDISELVELKRMLPICAHCHRVRDDAQYWQDVESYCRRKLDIEFSHGICPECLKRHYPDVLENRTPA
ncbi:MAG TPA: PAS domain-containing protein [Bryobacteraceae bacterium]|nr:PAS domain-containing protein [Bryobacteraceae bacterium]HPU73360.1 PAS domain-containing protein [Bryobacteraceae bacterium]